MIDRRTFFRTIFVVGSAFFISSRADARWVSDENKKKIVKDANEIGDSYYDGEMSVGDKLSTLFSRKYIEVEGFGRFRPFAGYYASKVNGQIVVTNRARTIKAIMTLDEVKAALGVK